MAIRSTYTRAAGSAPGGHHSAIDPGSGGPPFARRHPPWSRVAAL